MDTVTLGQLFREEGFEEIPHQGEISVAVIHKKGDRLQFDEDKPFIRQMISELSSVTAEGFGSPLDEKSNDGTRAHIQRVTGLSVLHDSRNLLGFASGIFPREDFFYLHGVVVSPTAKGRGGARALVRALLEPSGLDEVSFTTQNPVMFCMLRSLCKDVYPNINATIPPCLHPRAAELVRGRADTFDNENGILRNLYGRCLYPELPVSSDEAVNKWFSQSLNVNDRQTRDGFLFIGQGVR